MSSQLAAQPSHHLSSFISSTDTAILLALLVCCWLGTLIIGGIIAIYVKSVFDARSSSSKSHSPTRHHRHQHRHPHDRRRHRKHRHREDEELLIEGRKDEGLRRRKKAPQEQQGSSERDHANVYRETFKNQEEEHAINGMVSSCSDSTAEDEPCIPPRGMKYDDGGLAGHIEAAIDQMGAKSRIESTSSEKSPAAKSTPKSTIRPNQRAYETKCRQLLTDIKDHKAAVVGAKTVNENDGNDKMVESKWTSLRSALVDLRTLFEDLAIEFRGDRPGYVTTMILCCNVIMELDALSLLKSLQDLDQDMEEDSQFVIETVVPNIWSI